MPKQIKNVRIESLPQSIQKRILAWREKIAATPQPRIVTTRQLTRVHQTLEAGKFNADAVGWDATNNVLALGRVVLRYFEDQPEEARKFKTYVTNLQKHGKRVQDRTWKQRDNDKQSISA